MVGLDQQAEHLHRRIRPRSVEVHEYLADDRMKQRLSFVQRPADSNPLLPNDLVTFAAKRPVLTCLP